MCSSKQVKQLMARQCCQGAYTGFIHGGASCSSVDKHSLCCWMDVDEAPTHELACPRPSLRCLVPSSPSEQAQLSARVHSTVAYNNAAARFAQPHEPQPSNDSRNLQNPGLPQRWSAAQGQAPARSAALPAYAAAAPLCSPAAVSAGGSMYVPAGSCSSPGSSGLSRHQALLELVHILQRLHASSVCTDDAALPVLLPASQCAIQCVNSSMHVVRAALSAADIALADKAMDIATVAVQQAAARLQTATKLAAQGLLLSQQQQLLSQQHQQLLQARQVCRMPYREADTEDTCCSMYRC